MLNHLIDRIARRYFVAAITGAWSVSGGAAVTSAQTCEEITWSQSFPKLSPPGTGGPLVYDSQRQRSVMVVGPSQTWQWDGTNWSVSAIDGPDVSDGYAAAYDDINAVTILFNSAGQTWTWDGDQWRLVTNVRPPGAPYHPSMAFDSERGVAVMYVGGNTSEVWEWDGTSWAVRYSHPYDPKNPSSPGAQFGVAICYDSNEHRTIIFGGTSFDELDETWAWDGVQWTSLGRGGPHARSWASMTFDSVRQRRVLFGGIYFYFGGGVQAYGDTWESGEGMSWTLVDTTGPGERDSAAMTYDAAHHNIVLFGGEFGSNDTWIRGPEPIHGGPVIDTQPADQNVDPLGTATFSIVASGEGTITYQWRHNMVPLGDDPHRSGSHTATLTITGVTGADAGTYDVVVTNPCASVASDPVMLTIVFCPADFNTDGLANSQDFFDYLNAFFALSPSADFDHSGAVDSNDFFAFLVAFFAGCT